MRTMVALILLPLLFDVTPAGSLKKLAAKKTYAFTVATKIEGNLGGVARTVAENITGVFERPDVMTAKAGKKMQMVRKGSNALYLDGTEWKKEDDVENEGAAFRQLADFLAPHDEIAKWAPALAPLKVTLAVGGVECTVFRAELTKEGAADLAKDLLNGATEPLGLGDVPRGRVGRGRGVVRRVRTPIQPKDAKANIKLMVDPDGELPRQLIVEVTFKADFPVKGGKPDEREISIVRTVTLSDFDKAAPEISDEVKKKLGIGQK